MRKLTLSGIALAVLIALAAAAAAPAAKPVIRVGGPSAPGEAKLAVEGRC